METQFNLISFDQDDPGVRRIIEALEKIAENTAPIEDPLITALKVQRDTISADIQMIQNAVDNEELNIAQKFQILRNFINLGLQRIAQIERDINATGRV